MFHLGNDIIFPFCNFQNKASGLFILKQYFGPILMRCWKTWRNHALTFNSSLNERVMDCSTGGKVCPCDNSPRLTTSDEMEKWLATYTRLPSYSIVPSLEGLGTLGGQRGEVCTATACAVPVLWTKEAFSFQWCQSGTFHEHYITLKEKKWS